MQEEHAGKEHAPFFREKSSRCFSDFVGTVFRKHHGLFSLYQPVTDRFFFNFYNKMFVFLWTSFL